jgi:hypothetical protein
MGREEKTGSRRLKAAKPAAALLGMKTMRQNLRQ